MGTIGTGGNAIAAIDIEHITGGDGIDTLTGDGGDNTLIGMSGNDQLFGGAGADTYVYHYTGTRQDGIDTITEVDGGNIIQLYVAAPDDAWNLNTAGGLIGLIQFVSESSTQVRLTFGSDPDHYILLSNIDLDDNGDLPNGNSRFKLEIYDAATPLVLHETIKASVLFDAYEDFKDLAEEQFYEYDPTSPANKDLSGKGPVIIDIGIDGMARLEIDFSSITTGFNDQLKALLTSGLFSYEVVGTNLLLTFGNNNILKDDGITLKYPEETLTINNAPRPDITLKDTLLEFTSSNDFIASLNSFVLDASTMVDDTNKDSTYFIRGTSAETSDTADFSMVTDSVTLDLATRKGTLDGHELGVGSIEHITGGSGDDTLTGDDDLINTNTLTGGAGDDTLEGRAGADTLDGGTHNSGAGAIGDTASYKNSLNAVTVNLATNVNTGGHAQDDTLLNIENIIGSDNTATGDTLTGNDDPNRIEGGAGRDTLYGGGGGDTLLGGEGDDVLLSGGAGIDELYGGEGDDILEGGADADTLDGGNHGVGGDTASYENSLNAVQVDLSDGTAETGGDAEATRFLTSKTSSARTICS